MIAFGTRNMNKLFSKDITPVMHEKFNGFTKTHLCFINNPDKYGVYLSKEAEDYLIENGFNLQPKYEKQNNKVLKNIKERLNVLRHK